MSVINSSGKWWLNIVQKIPVPWIDNKALIDNIKDIIFHFNNIMNQAISQNIIKEVAED